MDILFQNEAKPGLPVVAEIKVGADRNAFYALIQAMTYAVEMSTPSQLKRLKKHYKVFSDSTLESVEILIVLVNSKSDDTTDHVKRLISTVNKEASKGSNWSGLNQVMMLCNNGNEWHEVHR